MSLGWRSPLAEALGKTVAGKLERDLGLSSVADLLTHYPRRYVERGRLTELDELVIGEEVTVLSELVSVQQRRMRHRKGFILEAVLGHGSSALHLTFFNQPWRLAQLQPGRRGLFAGKVGLYRGVRQLTNPDYMIFQEEPGPLSGGARPGGPDPASLSGCWADDEDPLAPLIEGFAGTLIPIYPAAASLPSWRVARCVRLVLDAVDPGADPLPEAVRERYGLCGRADALRGIHRPRDHAELDRARARLTFDEAFVLQMSFIRRRQAAERTRVQPRTGARGGLLDAFDACLPFQLTAAQARVGDEIGADLARAHPMRRLLHGEVGSGKTVVALRAMLRVVDSGGQAVLLAPTEVLAAQHARGIAALLGPLALRDEAPLERLARRSAAGAPRATGDRSASATGALRGALPAAAGGSDADLEAGTEVALLTASLPAARRRRVLEAIGSGAAGIVVGTHALFSQGVSFADLGLVVIDEQHRFGVEQRDALRDRGLLGQPPHLLVMTATPIPRTLAMTLYGDLDLSSLDELPAHRGAVATHVVGVLDRPHYVARAWERIREEVAAGRQVYVVCPRIGPRADPVPGGPAQDGWSAEGEDDDQVDQPPARAPVAGAPAAAGPRDALGSPAEEPHAGPAPPGGAGVLEVAAQLADGPLAGLRTAVLHGRLPPAEQEAVMVAFAAGQIDVLIATTIIEVGVDVANASMMVVIDAERFGVSQLHQLRGRVGRGADPGVCLLFTASPPGSAPRRRLEQVAATRDGAELAWLDFIERREGDLLGTAQSGRGTRTKLLDLVRDGKIIASARQVARDVAGAAGAAGGSALAEAVLELLDPDAEANLERA